MHTSKDVGTLTRGKGSAHRIAVAGTQHRREAIIPIAARYRRDHADDPVAAAIVLRDPTNAYDSNAIRVLIDGVHVGFLPRDEAEQWQPVLLECERRGVMLVGAVRFVGAEGWGLRLQLRDNLPGYEGPITKVDREQADMFAGDGVAALLDRKEFDKIAAVLVNTTAPKDKRSAGIRAKKVRDAMARACAHAAAIKATGDDQAAQTILDAAMDLDDTCEELIAASDKQDREDAAENVGFTGEELVDALRPTVPD